MEAISHAKETTPISIDYHEKIMRFSDCLAALQDPSVSALAKNKLLKSCVDKIIYYNNNESRCGIGRYVDNPFDLEIFLRL
jgi:site-specific DNA recombinase